MLGAPPEDKQERKRWRDHCKQTILGIINGMGPTGLAKRLGCDKTTAKFYLDKFEAACSAPQKLDRCIMEGWVLKEGASTWRSDDSSAGSSRRRWSWTC